MVPELLHQKHDRVVLLSTHKLRLLLHRAVDDRQSAAYDQVQVTVVIHVGQHDRALSVLVLSNCLTCFQWVY